MKEIFSAKIARKLLVLVMLTFCLGWLGYEQTDVAHAYDCNECHDTYGACVVECGSGNSACLYQCRLARNHCIRFCDPSEGGGDPGGESGACPQCPYGCAADNVTCF